MTKQFTITFSDAQWRVIRRLGGEGRPPAIVRAAFAKLFAERDTEFPDDLQPVGGYRGGGRPRKRKELT